MDAAEDPAWDAALPAIAAAPPQAGGVLVAPLIHGLTLTPDARRMRRLLRDLLGEAEGAVAASGRAPRPTDAPPRRLDPRATVAAAIALDGRALNALAGRAGVDAELFGVVAHFAATPVLHACGRRLQGSVPAGWDRGYCPICGAWPALAELRGIERGRHLRCVRCGGDWSFAVLRCPYCEEDRHAELSSLLPEGEEHRRRVDVCHTCKGYLKAFPTLRAMTPRAIAMADLDSVDLDLIAHERGYSRPPEAAFAVKVTLAPPSKRGAPAAARADSGPPEPSAPRPAQAALVDPASGERLH